MKKIVLIGLLILLSACSASEGKAMKITAEQAKQKMEESSDFILVDVRTVEEYNDVRIPGAINLPNETITNVKPQELPDLNQTIFVYCRSGNRSAQAAAKLAAIGYTKVYDFGGIIDWPYETQ
jgi:phage shock protein E